MLEDVDRVLRENEIGGISGWRSSRDNENGRFSGSHCFQIWEYTFLHLPLTCIIDLGPHCLGLKIPQIHSKLTKNVLCIIMGITTNAHRAD